MKASLLFALVLAAFPVMAAAAPAEAPAVPAATNRFANAPVPAERFEIDGMRVERHGSGPALILIPGLASGAWVWQETIRAFASTHTVYAVTLPGFDGVPALAADPAANPFDAARAALAKLLATRRIDKAVLVGHSLGGTLALALASEQPARIKGVVSIDGLPVMPRTENAPPESRAQLGESMRQRIAGVTGPAFAAQQLQYMRSIGAVDMGKADDMAQLSARSDPQAVASYVGAVLALDLRPRLPELKAPVLVLAPWYGPDAAVDGIGTAEKLAYYRELMTGTPRLEVAAIENARHFAMIDQPQATNAALRRFIAGL